MGGPPMAVRLAPSGTPAIGPGMYVYVVSGNLGGSVPPIITFHILLETGDKLATEAADLLRTE